jgi:hypothetical protein
MEIEYIKNSKTQLQNEIFFIEQIITNYLNHKSILLKNETIDNHYSNFDITVYQLQIEKNKDTISKLDEQLKKICKHHIIYDVIDLDYGERQKQICYCEVCELNF